MSARTNHNNAHETARRQLAFRMYLLRKRIARYNAAAYIDAEEAAQLETERRELLTLYYAQNYGANVKPLFTGTCTDHTAECPDCKQARDMPGSQMQCVACEGE